MAEQNTDLLCQWLGLPPGSWPPDPYKLLGLTPGEADPRKIEQAADQRLSTLRPYQLKHADLASEGMNAVAQALVSLTSPTAQAAQQARGSPLGAAFGPAPTPTGAPAPAPAAAARPVPPSPLVGKAFGTAAGTASTSASPALVGPAFSQTSAPLPPSKSPLLTGFPPAPPPRPNLGRAFGGPPPAPTVRGAPLSPLLTAKGPQPGTPGSPVPPATTPGQTPPGTPSLAGSGSALGDVRRVMIVGPLPVPVILAGGMGAGMGGLFPGAVAGSAGESAPSPSWRGWQTGGLQSQRVPSTGPSVLAGTPGPGGRPSVATVLQNQPGSMLGVTGGTGGMPPSGMWGPFNQGLNAATRNLNTLGRSTEGAYKVLGKASDAVGVLGGPIGDKLRGMFSGTLSGMMGGAQMGGWGGAAVGAAAGFMRDIPQLGAAANPQAGASWEQTWELAKTKTGGTVGADIALNQATADVQKTLELLNKLAGVRSMMQQKGGAVVRGMAPVVLPGIGSLIQGGAIGDYMEGKLSAAPEKPAMQALPQIAGIGGAMGQSMSIEGFSQAMGMSTMNMSQIELQTIQEQLRNMNEAHGATLKEIAESVRNVRTIRPAFR